MKTKTITLYSFNELSEAAKKKVLEDQRHINTEHYDWYQFLIEEYEEEILKEAGFEDAKIHFSGFWSQGDGASFDAKINIEKFATGRTLKIAEQTNWWIDKTSFANHYSHEKTRYVEYNGIGTNRQTNIEGVLKELSKDIESKRLDLCREIYKKLEETYESLVTDEAIIETIEANEYTFTENGKLENE